MNSENFFYIGIRLEFSSAEASTWGYFGEDENHKIEKFFFRVIEQSPGMKCVIESDFQLKIYEILDGVEILDTIYKVIKCYDDFSNFKKYREDLNYMKIKNEGFDLQYNFD